ncbi:MAG: GNAT family N-acetyltransferase [Actinobacteria bacterium]|nr:GNAT family N-acetyltransferase [Actinomycetota bacterium]
MRKPVLRDATGDDLESLIAIKDEATSGWGMGRIEPGSDRYRNNAAGLEHLRATGRTVVAERHGMPVGFGSAIVREDVWYLSQLFVSPAEQASGVGAAILDELLDGAASARARTVISSDDPKAFGLYTSRGMLPRWIHIEYRRHHPKLERPEVPEPDALTPADQPAVDALERAQRGFARTVDHEFLSGIKRGYALREGDRLRAFFYADDSGVGPLAGADDAWVSRAVDAADAIGGPDVVWWVPSTAPGILTRLLSLGYRSRSLTTFCSGTPVGPFDRIATSGGLLM